MPTLAVGQAADLKLETETMRVWISRCGRVDGELRPVQVEYLTDGRWIDVTTPDHWYKNPRVSAFKDFYLDAGPYQGYRITAITRNRRN